MCSDRQNIGRLSKQLIHPGTFYTQRDCQFNVIIINEIDVFSGRLSTAQMNENILRCTVVNDRIIVVRYSSAVRRLFVRLAGAVGHQSTLHKENSGFATPTLGWHISTFRGYQILFSIQNPYINRFTNHFSIHS
jgi:hypothetical protein